MHRLFFALIPGDALRREIADLARQQALLSGGRAVRPDRYHMTLQFIGDFDLLTTAMRSSLLAAADAIATRKPFDIVLDRVGSFGGGRVVWLGCSTPQEALTRLHQGLADALVAADVALKPEAGFVPHLTLHRNADSAVDRPIPPQRWRVEDFALIDAIAGEYRPLGRWSLVPA